MNSVTFQQNFNGMYILVSGRNEVFPNNVITVSPFTISSGIANPNTFPYPNVGKFLGFIIGSVILNSSQQQYVTCSVLTKNGRNNQNTLTVSSGTGFSANDSAFLYGVPQTFITASSGIVSGNTIIPVADVEPFDLTLYEKSEKLLNSNYFAGTDSFNYTGISADSGPGYLTGVTGITTTVSGRSLVTVGKIHTQDFMIKSISGNVFTIFERLKRNFCKGGDYGTWLVKCPTIVINGTTESGATTETVYVTKHNSITYTRERWLTVTSVVVTGFTGGVIACYEAVDPKLIASYADDPVNGQRVMRVVKPLWQGDNDLRTTGNNCTNASNKATYDRTVTNWTTNLHLGQRLLLVGGGQTNSNSERTIISNTTTRLTMSGTWTTGNNRTGAIIYKPNVSSQVNMLLVNGLWSDISPGTYGAMKLVVCLSGYTSPSLSATVTIDGRDPSGNVQQEVFTVPDQINSYTVISGTKFFSSILQADLAENFQDSVMPTISGGISCAGNWGNDDGKLFIIQPFYGILRKSDRNYNATPNVCVHGGWDGVNRQNAVMKFHNQKMVLRESFRNSNVGSFVLFKRWRDCYIQSGDKLGDQTKNGGHLHFHTVMSQDDNNSAYIIPPENQAGGCWYLYDSKFSIDFYDNIGSVCDVYSKMFFGAENVEVVNCTFENVHDVFFQNRAATQINQLQNFGLMIDRINLMDAVMGSMAFIDVMKDIISYVTTMHRYASFGSVYTLNEGQLFNIKIKNGQLISGNKIFVYHFNLQSGNPTLSMYNCLEMLSVADVYFDVFSGSGGLVKTFRTFSLLTEPFATVILIDSMGVVYNYTADSDGYVWEKDVLTSQVYWESNPAIKTLNSYYPYTLIIKKPGYGTHQQDLSLPNNMGEGWDFEVRLQKLNDNLSDDIVEISD